MSPLQHSKRAAPARPGEQECVRTQALREIVAPYDIGPAMLSLALGNRAAEDMLLDRPTILWLLLHEVPALMNAGESYSALLSNPAKSQLARLDLPPEKRVSRLIEKIRLSRFEKARIAAIKSLLRAEKRQALTHARKINERALEVLSRYPALMGTPLAGAILHAEGQDQEEFCDVFYRLQRLGQRLGQSEDFLRRATSRRSLPSLRRLEAQLTRQWPLEILSAPLPAFPPPPVDAPSGAVAIRNHLGLWQEARDQHNCVYDYRDRIIAGEYCVFRLTQPERATLGVNIDARGKLQLDELKGPWNREVHPDTLRHVLHWLERTQRPLPLAPAKVRLRRDELLSAYAEFSRCPRQPQRRRCNPLESYDEYARLMWTRAAAGHHGLDDD